MGGGLLAAEPNSIAAVRIARRAPDASFPNEPRRVSRAVPLPACAAGLRLFSTPGVYGDDSNRHTSPLDPSCFDPEAPRISYAYFLYE